MARCSRGKIHHQAALRIVVVFHESGSGKTRISHLRAGGCHQAGAEIQGLVA
jgi:hypothetical protein